MKKNCILCGHLTDGSISAAGNFWNTICPTCRESEDAAAKLNVKALAQGMKFLLDAIGLGELEKNFGVKTPATQNVTTRGN